ncbi:MAG: hypothetical protein WCT14_17085 [Treponemataceae bacterium]
MKKPTLIVLFAYFAVSLSAQSFRPFTDLRVIETKRFDIVFSERSRRTAEYLATFADACYERVSSLLDIKVRSRIPVTITPDSDAFNGYMNPIPYPHIVLFDTPMDPEWTTFRDSLEGIFLHELTHAVSMSSRGPFAEFFAGLFGGWVMPAAMTAPYFMVEGVTVSFESLDGFGRANDPLIKERLAQAIRDGNFLTPFQAAGVYDKPGGSPYHYGGLFSAYIQKRWGMETYARLWKAMGTRFPISIDFYNHGFFRIFRDVCGVDFGEVWADFAAELTVVGLEDNKANRLVGGELLFDSLVSGGGRLFFADTVKYEVSAYDPANGRTVRIAQIDATATDIDVSADGKLLLVASYRLEDSLATAIVNEFDTASGTRTARFWKGIYKPRYFRDGIVGIASDRYTNRIVTRDALGKETLLLAGDAERVYSAPAPIDENRIAFIVAEKGLRRIGVHDLRTKRTVLIRTDLPDDVERFRYARDLRAVGGKLYFSYTTGKGFYKLAVVDESGVVFSERDFSGGIFSAAEAGGALYYRGAFSTWDAVLRFPEKADGITGTRATITVADQAPLSDSRSLVVGPPAASGISERSFAERTFAERQFSGLSYLNPFRFWLPYPLIRTEGQGLRFDGGGFLSYLSDPTDTDTVILTAGYDRVGNMGFASLQWTSYGFGVPFALNVSDSIEFETGSGDSQSYRASRAGLSVSYSRGLGDERNRFSLGASASAVAFALDPKDGSSAYAWRYDAPVYALGISAKVSNLYRPTWRLFGSGADLAAYGYLSLPSATYRGETVFRAAIEPLFPLRVTAYAAYDEAGMSLDGTSVTYGTASFEGLSEYAAEAASTLPWMAGGSAEVSVISLETQGNFTHLYFNRVFAVASWRGAGYGAEDGPRFVHSLVLKTGAVISGIPVASIPLRFSPYLWAAWKLSDLNDGNPANDYAFGFLFSLTW